MLSKTLAAVTAALMLTPAMADAQAPPDHMLRAEALQKVSDHVWVIPDQGEPAVPNAGIIVGERAALVVDTGLGERNGRVVLEAAQKVAPGRDLYLVTTHVHPEHDLGAHAFPASTRMIRSGDQQKEIAETGLQVARIFSDRSPVMAELLQGAEFREADVVFGQEHRLDLGGVEARILAMGPNHTPGDTAIWVGADRVLFSGDVVMRGQPAVISPSSSVAHWLASLDRLQALEPTLIVPSHGPMGDAGLIDGYRTYLTAIRDRAGELKRQGRSVDETVQAVTADLQPQYPDANRMAGAIRAAYAEAR